MSMERADVERMAEHGTTIERALAMSWLDADDYRSVKQNAGQRKALIESAISEAQDLLKNAS